MHNTMQWNKLRWNAFILTKVMSKSPNLWTHCWRHCHTYCTGGGPSCWWHTDIPHLWRKPYSRHYLYHWEYLKCCPVILVGTPDSCNLSVRPAKQCYNRSEFCSAELQYVLFANSEQHSHLLWVSYWCLCCELPLNLEVIGTDIISGWTMQSGVERDKSRELQLYYKTSYHTIKPPVGWWTCPKTGHACWFSCICNICKAVYATGMLVSGA